MTIQLDWDLLVLVGLIAFALILLGAAGHYVWHEIRHR
ncbi:hypothetical protein EV580_1298 [Mycobacterium sp. BK086]|nr:hypothetical protein EV580_1298 [Mycobacterium sp. BK086]